MCPQVVVPMQVVVGTTLLWGTHMSSSELTHHYKAIPLSKKKGIIPTLDELTQCATQALENHKQFTCLPVHARARQPLASVVMTYQNINLCGWVES